MTPPLIARLLLDAHHEFLKAADAVPEEARDRPPRAGLNAGGWVVAHAGFFHDVWINCDAQGKRPDEAREPWLLDWFRQQRSADLGEIHPGRGHGQGSAIDTSFAEARAAMDRSVSKASLFMKSLTDEALVIVPAYDEGAWPPNTTVGYLVARAVAHMFAHASELSVIINAAGGQAPGLPGRLSRTHTYIES